MPCFSQNITTSFAERKSINMEIISPRVAIDGVTTLSGSKPNLNIPIASRAAIKERIIPDVKDAITQIRTSLIIPALSKPRARVTKCPRIPSITAAIILRIREPEILFMSSGLCLSRSVISPR
jgi:hypothetical protein